MDDGRQQRDAAERILVDDEIPPAFERDLRSLSDIARNPLVSPLATLGAVLILVTVGYQSYVFATTGHPLVGLLVPVVAAIAYAIAKRLWVVQHRSFVRELAKDGELDRLR